jgi:ABC-type branched-subunit amino acid transport system ATPase component
MNAIGGYVRAGGRVELGGVELDSQSPVARARLGLGRAFQNATLFSDLTVRETVMLALEARDPTRLASSVFGLPGARRAESRKAREAAELVDFVGLGRYRDFFVSDLSTGTRRICELACLVALDAHVLCLDEPTAGVAQRETEAFGPLLRAIQRELGCAMLVIEHDMPMVMALSDRVYCLEAGRVIAEGTPTEVRHDPLVVASYLGTDERAINRSDALR